jgi:peptidoglycan/xylan/chitin deacetylase (PgdA/CDA1 family)
MASGSFKSKVKSAALHGICASGVTGAVSDRLGVNGVILTFHEIHDDPRFELGTGCPTTYLDRCITWLREAGWEIISLSEAIERLRRSKAGPKFAVFTFDDGYRDNISRALPILRRQEVPFTIYISSAAITRDLFAWWLGLREIFRNNETVHIAAMNRSFSCADLPSKMRNLAVADNWVHQDYKHVPELRDTFAAYGISCEELCDRYFMGENELHALAREPLITIGAHSITHPALATLNAEIVLHEMVGNRAHLQTFLDRDVSDFAYPFGNSRACGSREAALAAQSGFRTAATTSNRPLFADDGDDLFLLPRVSIHPHWTLAHLDAAISGLTMPSMRRLAVN